MSDLSIAAAEKKLRRLLAMIDSKGKHDKVKSLRHRDTGAWLFGTPEYGSWFKLNVSSVLCCYGIRKYSEHAA